MLQIHCGASEISVSKVHSPHLRTPPHPNLPPSDPLSASLGQMLALGDQTLMDRAGQHRDAVLAHLVAEVLAGDADSARARVHPYCLQGGRGVKGSGNWCRRPYRSHTPETAPVTPALLANRWCRPVLATVAGRHLGRKQGLPDPADAITAWATTEVLAVDAARSDGCHMCQLSSRPL